MRVSGFLFQILLLVCSACANAPSKEQTNISPTTSTITATQTPQTRASHTPRFPPTSTATVTPTHKPFIASYVVYGGDGGDEIIRCLNSFASSHFRLYEDNFLIYLTTEGYQQASLSPFEVQEFISSVEETGFFDVEQPIELARSPLDPIYEFDEGTITGDGGGLYYVNVNGHTIIVYPPIEEYLVQPIADTLEIIRNYKPTTSEIYIPDELVLMIVEVIDNNIDWLAATPVPPTADWPKELTTLHELAEERRFSYFFDDKETIELLNQYYSGFPGVKIFVENNHEYIVVACPSIP